ncbi:MAG: Flp pilus assembly protein CpaB [Deltaproteobacteria bacterium]|nr:Flp pilus assembly protein CpaB [Deltaproteobacteria bacterium]
MPARTSVRASRRRANANLAGTVMLSAAVLSAALLVRGGRSEQTAAASTPNVTVAQFDTVRVPVPVDSVPAGTRVSEIRFKNISFPSHQVPKGAITDVTAHLDSVTTALLPANLPLFAANLSTQEHSINPVLERIPAGMRAMTLKVDATSAVEGWAGSGSFVDILLVEKNRTTVVAEMVRILSAERSVSPVEGNAAPNVPSTVTVLVTQEQCLAINTAIPLGKIAFALRGNDDRERWSSTTFTADSLKSGSLVKDSSGVITGYFEAGGAKGGRSFALTDGKWIETEVVPDGFLAGKTSRKAGRVESNAKD